jgi:phosphohistidine phosphatase
MDLYFVRHGLAVERSASEPDVTRPLTPEGLDRTRKLAKLLKRMAVSFDMVLTSPLVRALETAQILVDGGLARELVIFPPLQPGGDFSLFKTWLAEHPMSSVAVVGHQPDLGAWVELFLFGEIKQCIPLKKSGVACLELTKHETQLRWLLPPKILDSV